MRKTLLSLFVALGVMFGGVAASVAPSEAQAQSWRYDRDGYRDGRGWRGDRDYRGDRRWRDDRRGRRHRNDRGRHRHR